MHGDHTFARLVAAGRPPVRAFVYNQVDLQYDTAVQCIQQGGDGRIGNTYLLAAFGDADALDTPRIVYYRIDAHQRQAADQCELAPIAEDYYPGWAMQLVQV